MKRQYNFNYLIEGYGLKKVVSVIKKHDPKLYREVVHKGTLTPEEAIKKLGDQRRVRNSLEAQRYFDTHRNIDVYGVGKSKIDPFDVSGGVKSKADLAKAAIYNRFPRAGITRFGFSGAEPGWAGNTGVVDTINASLSR